VEAEARERKLLEQKERMEAFERAKEVRNITCIYMFILRLIKNHVKL
jgi:hypothetical protein